MKILCVIPARIGSTRLARKALLPIAGKPMVQWTYEAAAATTIFTKVIVATDAQEIAEVVQRCGGEAMMTDVNIPTGTDRAAVVANHFSEMDIIVNLQGDEPFIKPQMLESLIMPFLHDNSVCMTTLACPLNFETEYENPNIVKVLVDKKGDAIYFTRAAVPYLRESVENIPVFHHQGVYAFRREFLNTFAQLPTTALQTAESLEQLRALEHGYRIRVAVTPYRIIEINTEEEWHAANHHAQELLTAEEREHASSQRI